MTKSPKIALDGDHITDVVFAALAQRVKKLSHGFAANRIDGLRRNFVEWNKDECAFCQTRMGNLQMWLTYPDVSHQ